MDMDRLVRDFEKAVTIDYVGLWEMVGAVSDNIEDRNAENIRRSTLALGRRMLARGFRAGQFTGSGQGVVAWEDQDPDSVIRRIESEWDKIGGEPNINDICWFIGPK